MFQVPHSSTTNAAKITAKGHAGVICQFVDQICLPALGRKAYPTSSLLPEAIPDYGLTKTGA